MIRTFHSRIDKKVLLLCLLPGTVLAVWAFWVKWPLVALLLMVYLVFVVERLIHTEYVFVDGKTLFIRRGRFAKTRTISLDDIANVEVLSHSAWSLLRGRDTVAITQKGGAVTLVTPFPADDFCKYLLRMKKENGAS